MVEILVTFVLPILICVVLPVVIVSLVMRDRQNEANRRAEIMLRSIESGSTIDPELFKPQKREQKSLKEKLLGRLTGGCITSLLGIVFFVGGQFLGWKLNMGALPSLPLLGGILLAVGIALIVSYIAGKKMLAKEIEAEENNLNASK